MKTLKSYINGTWHEATEGFATLLNPATGEEVARASSVGIDFGAALDHARREGGASLRAMTFAQRGSLLKQMSRALHEHREELLDISVANNGTTRNGAKFDVDGATGTLSYYAALGRGLGERRWLADGEGEQLGRTSRFWGQHVLVPRQGAAVLINAFNFPAWGFGEKAAAALLAGMPVIVKPATSTAWLTERCVEILVEAEIMPPGTLSLISGSTGDLLSHMGGQDVLAFTGSAATARKLRGLDNFLETSTRVNIEADSLNAAVLAADVEPGSETWNLFVNEVAREMTQKSGQKCTAVRRIFAPSEHCEALIEMLGDRLAEEVVGDPREKGVTMGPLATAAQLEDAVSGVARLAGAATVVHGDGKRVDGRGAAPGKGFFFAPTLLMAAPDAGDDVLHDLEVFGPVATILPYTKGVDELSAAVGKGGGSLVTSLYTDSQDTADAFLAGAGAFTGRLYIGSAKVAEQLPGSGIALPQSQHGGPGRAGGGSELGGLRALELYSQRVALQGNRPLIERAAGSGA